MKVKKLMDQLSQLDPAMEIVGYVEEKMSSSEKGFLLLDINGVDVKDCELMRLNGVRPYVKFGKSPNSQTVAFMDLTSDF